MSRSVLLTAAKEDTETFQSELRDETVSVLHYPLERYELVEDDQDVRDTFKLLDEFENIVHGSKRNAMFFVEAVEKYDKMDAVRNQLNLALNQHTADYLEEAGIPAVHPHSDGKAIDLLEFMLRIKHIGSTLYPCGDKTSESMPGLLRELDVPVEELVLFTLEGPEELKLQEYRKDIAAHDPAFIIFHSRRSVNRLLAAFPNLNYSEAHITTGDQAVTEKLEGEGIEVDSQAEGSWSSIRKIIKEELEG
ncbi:uroporphyrinogen-III synthase [Fodinibius saliphilus]|uniref:uroporphyrinogen-III synthase n=1 Tax=Fodinibius saliphilus TaxID=1920650 RepID=UPI001107CDCC|nr:uroporphyrinogen-III synthase [Fodinibius saliphilus]